nr:acyltransferase [Pseudoalteromonas sp. TB51]
MKIVFRFLGYIFSRAEKIIELSSQAYFSNYFSGVWGTEVKINGKLIIHSANNCIIGKNVHIGGGGFIKAEGGLEIGDNTHISRNLVLYTCSHEYEGTSLPYDERLRLKKVIIGKNVWIGMNVVILPGAVIEDGAIVGAGAVVAGKIKKGEIHVASSSVKLKSRNKELYDSNEKQENYSGVNGRALK